jgi:predicted transcriptional regulator
VQHIDYHQYVNTRIHNKANTKVSYTKHGAEASDAQGCVSCFNSLGISSRMAIYRFLREKHRCTVNAIVAQVGLTQPTISYHLNEMKNSGILKSERAGKEVYYMIDEQCRRFDRACVLKTMTFPA